MTDVTENRGQAETELSAADEQLLRELTERARTGGLRLTGEGGLLGRLTKMVIEGALEGELDDHLGYCKHDPEGAELVNLSDRVVRPPHRPEPVGDGLEVRLEDGFQHEFQRGLDHLVGHGGDGDFILLLLQSRLGWIWLCRHRRWPRGLAEVVIVPAGTDIPGCSMPPAGLGFSGGRVEVAG